MSAAESHRSAAPKKLRIAIIRSSTSRYQAMLRGEPYVDDSSAVARRMLEELGHEVKHLGLVGDEIIGIRAKLSKALAEGYDVVAVIGGTGISRRDVSIEAVRPLLEKEIEGVGEIFRVESYKRIGFHAALSRCIAGVISGSIILVLPGSPDAVETALKLIGPELPHMVHVARM
ncbi:Molybdenum cofactor biosynthesis protein B [Candidatus Calditenuaceae archaeon HR02]|nr:Molybdenum cofactor biosynthesis protein B [Candidatus Calditenuaceae archaeon HR02]